MSQKDIVHCLKKGYSPFIYRNRNSFIYCFPVSSGHADVTFEFGITTSAFEILKADEYRFKALYFLLFLEVQSTFGTGNNNPRTYSQADFERCKHIVLTKSEEDLKLYLQDFSTRMNVSQNYFETFSKSMF